MIRYFFYFFPLLLIGCQPTTSSLQGYIEGEYQYITSTTSGILKTLYVQRGDFISQGANLFTLEDIELNVAIENAKAEIRQAKALLKETTSAYHSRQKLIQSHAISQSELDQKEAEYTSSKARVEASQQKLISAERKLEESRPKAMANAYVENTYFVPGEFIEVGKAVISLLPPEKIKIRFFLPQSQLPKINTGKYITISCDGCAKKIKAKIIYIAKQAEYTPPVIYSTESRQKMVFMVEAKPDEIEPCLHPGLPVDINIENISA